MKAIHRTELGDPIRQDLLKVEAVLNESYSPYSNLCVAAGLILKSGGLVTGVNYESASYGLTLCAERSAIARAQVEGSLAEVCGLILATRNRDNDFEKDPLTPCGACRQWLAELSDRLGKDFPVYSFWNGGETGLQGTVRELLPRAFL